MMTDRDSSVAGIDNRPPMLEEDDFELWKIRMEREKTDDEYTDAENLKEQFDIQVAGILSQGLPRRIFNILNRTSTAKEIWDSLELLMKGSGKTLERRKEDMFDEYERFRANGNESIQDYFICFHKLVNDMKVTQIDLPKHQLNTKFVNNLPAYWSKYSSTPPQPSPKPTTQAAQTHEEALMATMQQLANMLSGFQKQFPPTNNQLRASSNPRSQATGQRENQANGSKVVCYNCRGEGRSSRCGGRSIPQANHEDAYDSDVDDRLDASIAFMANFSSAGSPSSSNNISINK
nr:hypothetical protein [Tanacetum cinerariifolium]